MTYPKTAKALDAMLRRRLSHNGPSENCRLRYQLQKIEEHLAMNKRDSPGAWAVSVAGCARVLSKFAQLPDRQMFQSILGMSAERVINLMAECAKRAKAGAAGYVERGINPQVQITINPYLEKARSALAAWRARLEAERLKPEPRGTPFQRPGRTT